MEATENNNIAIRTKDLKVSYAGKPAVHGITMEMEQKKVTAFIGPSGCGKSTILRCFNRMNDVIPDISIEGEIKIFGTDVYHESTRIETLRKRVGMVFQKSNPFPMTIRQNIVFGPKMRGIKDRSTLDGIVEKSLTQADLWREVKDRLDDSALDLSGGQQQRLCIARTLANEPEVILMDEPASALDPISTAKIEETIQELKNDYTIVIVTHNMQQASRVSDYTAFFYMGELIEMGKTDEMFIKPKVRKTEDYITGRFG